VIIPVVHPRAGLVSVPVIVVDYLPVNKKTEVKCSLNPKKRSNFVEIVK
jgi:hypothetical protein